MKLISFSELVFNFDFYPRSAVDEERVQMLSEVLLAGGELPPLVIDSHYRVVDGFHRARAHRAIRGHEAPIECEIREYATDVDFLLDAIGRNAQHGKPLTLDDHEHCVALAQRHGVSVAQLADVLSVRVERVTGLAKTKPIQAGRAKVNGHTTPNGNGSHHFEDITRYDLRTDPARIGLHQINAVLVAIQNGTLDVHDRRINQGLRNLVKVALERLKEEAIA